MDTDESIPNVYSNRPAFSVTLIDDKGNKWTETAYDGYGIFGGMDYYVLLAKMNRDLLKKIKESKLNFKDTEKVRDMGIDLEFDDDEAVKKQITWPNLVRNPGGWEWKNQEPESCPDQGFFYESEEDEEEDDY